MTVALLRMASKTRKQYDLDMDHFIVKALEKKILGYKDLFRLIKEKYRSNISYDTFNRHIRHLKTSGMINKDQKYAPFYLTEKCKSQLKLGALNLVPPAPKLNESSQSSRIAVNRINMYTLILLFKSGSSYEFEKIEELEYFLSIFNLNMNSFSPKSLSRTLQKVKNEVYSMEVFQSNDGRVSVNKKKYVFSANRIRYSTSFVCNIKGVKYPLANYTSDPFTKAGVMQEEINESLTLLSNEGILQKPNVYSGDSIYLFTDIRMYDLLFDLAFHYGWTRSILKKIWNLRNPVPTELQWLQRIEGELAVRNSIERAQKHKRKAGLMHHKKKKELTKIIRETSKELRGI